MLLESEEKFEEIQEDDHLLHMWTPIHFEIDKNYQFVPTSKLFHFISNLLYWFAFPIVIVFNKLFYNFHIEGFENLKKVTSGKITVSNHIHPMDCTMNAIANFPHKVYFPTLKSNFQIPVVRHLIRLLHAIPIPDKIDTKIKFFQCLNTLLQNNQTIHFYPEGSLWPYYHKLRTFKDGAFRLAVENQVPIIPMVYQFQEATGIRKYIKKNPFITLTVLEPIYPASNLKKAEAIQLLKNQVYDSMKKEITK